MTNRSEETKRTLRTLATAPRREAPEHVVGRAAATLSSVERAARFLDDEGTERLAEAVVCAGRAGDRETVSCGRQTLTELHALEAALDLHTPPHER